MNYKSNKPHPQGESATTKGSNPKPSGPKPPKPGNQYLYSWFFRLSCFRFRIRSICSVIPVKY